MEETPSEEMEIRPRKIIRRSIFTFLKYYQDFTTIPALLMLPFSVFVLLLQASSSSSSSFFIIHGFGFSPFLQVFLVVNFGVSCTIFSSGFVMAKGYVIQAMNQQDKVMFPPSFSYLVSLHKSLFLTQVCNSVIIITSTIVVFSVMFMAFSSKNSILVLVAGSVSYSFLANTMIICNFALILTGMENNFSGCLAILKACSLVRSRNSMALLMALPANIGGAAIAALFRYRILGAYHTFGRIGISMALEGMLIAYLYSLLLVVDTIVSCLFFKGCQTDVLVKGEANRASASTNIP